MITDRRGTPLAARITGANRHDSTMLEPMVDAVHPIRGGRGRPRKRHVKLHADKGYANPRWRQPLTKRHIPIRIARRGIESKTKLGRHRWVVERTMAWLRQFRRLTVRYERRQEIHEAFLSLGCSLLCFNAIQRF